MLGVLAGGDDPASERGGSDRHLSGHPPVARISAQMS